MLFSFYRTIRASALLLGTSNYVSAILSGSRLKALQCFLVLLYSVPLKFYCLTLFGYNCYSLLLANYNPSVVVHHCDCFVHSNVCVLFACLFVACVVAFLLGKRC